MPMNKTSNSLNFSVSDNLLKKVADKYLTPVFVFDYQCFVNRLKYFKDVFSNAFSQHNIQTSYYYASKAFICKYIASLVSDYGYKIDTCSYYESLTALKAGVDGSKLGLHGNNKSEEEIILAINNEFSRIVIDSEYEYYQICQLFDCGLISAKNRVKVMLRVTTGVHAGGHEYISTAHEDQKFGVSIASGHANELLKTIIADERFNLVGIHSHIGSQIVSEDGFIEAAQKMIDLRLSVYNETKYLIPEIDLGGGFGIKYSQSDDEINLENVASKIASKIAQYPNPPHISFEPGRYLIGPAMVTLYTVGAVKDVKIDNNNIRKYVSVDGGMADNIRPSLYGAKYLASIVDANNTASKDLQNVRIVGKHCESGDILIDSIDLPKSLSSQNLLKIHNTGAYGYSMSSNYNLLPKPAVIGVKDGQIFEIIKRQSEAELIR